MDPLAAYLLSVLKRQATDDTRRFVECAWALQELGYWLLVRPTSVPRDKMPATKISTECVLVDEFCTYCPSTVDCDGFEEAVDVYADPLVADMGYRR